MRKACSKFNLWYNIKLYNWNISGIWGDFKNWPGRKPNGQFRHPSKGWMSSITWIYIFEPGWYGNNCPVYFYLQGIDLILSHIIWRQARSKLAGRQHRFYLPYFSQRNPINSGAYQLNPVKLQATRKLTQTYWKVNKTAEDQKQNFIHLIFFKGKTTT